MGPLSRDYGILRHLKVFHRDLQVFIDLQVGDGGKSQKSVCHCNE